MGKQNDLSGLTDGEQRLQHYALAHCIRRTHNIVKDQRANLTLPRQVPRQGEPEQQINLFRGSVREQLSTVPAVRPLNFHQEGLRVYAAVVVAAVGDTG